MNPDLWITVPNWERFQHYGLARNPAWIKSYTELLRKNEYMDLTLPQRGLLHGIWLAYAATRGRLRVRDAQRMVGGNAKGKSYEALNHAGFIGFRASKPLYLSLEELPSTTGRSSKGRGSGGREATPKGAALRRRTAEEWLAGPGRLVPESQLADDLREKLKITDPETLAQLLARAQEFRT